MGLLDELTSATGEKSSNTDMVKRCLTTPALLHTIAEGLRTGTPKARVDCAQILVDVAKRRPELLASFVTDFLDASREAKRKGGSKRIARLGFSGLGLVARIQPAEVFAERDYLLGMAADGGALGQQAAAVVAGLCQLNANYRGKLLGSILRLLNRVADEDLPKWVSAISVAAEGSPDAVKRLEITIAPRRATLPEAARTKIEKVLKKLNGAAAKPKKKSAVR